MKKTWIIILIIIIFVAIIWFWYSRTKNIVGLPQFPGIGTNDTTAEINSDLGNIDIKNIDQEFEEIDKNLNSL